MDKKTCGVIAIGMGLIGLYFGVEYSGWVLFVGLIVIA